MRSKQLITTVCWVSLDTVLTQLVVEEPASEKMKSFGFIDLTGTRQQPHPQGCPPPPPPYRPYHPQRQKV